MKDWAVWLVTLQTGAIAAIGWLQPFEAMGKLQQLSGVIALWCLGWSVFAFAWLLGSLPSIQQRIIGGNSPHRPTRANDIYLKSLFETVNWAKWLTLERVAAFSHYTGIAGLLLFSCFFIAGMNAQPQGGEVASAIVDLGNRLAPANANALPTPEDKVLKAIEKLEERLSAYNSGRDSAGRSTESLETILKETNQILRAMNQKTETPTKQN